MCNAKKRGAIHAPRTTLALRSDLNLLMLFRSWLTRSALALRRLTISIGRSRRRRVASSSRRPPGSRTTRPRRIRVRSPRWWGIATRVRVCRGHVSRAATAAVRIISSAMHSGICAGSAAISRSTCALCANHPISAHHASFGRSGNARRAMIHRRELRPVRRSRVFMLHLFR